MLRLRVTVRIGEVQRPRAASPRKIGGGFILPQLAAAPMAAGYILTGAAPIPPAQYSLAMNMALTVQQHPHAFIQTAGALAAQFNGFAAAEYQVAPLRAQGYNKAIHGVCLAVEDVE